MHSYREECREWLAAQLEKRGRGARSDLARHMNVGPETITRMLATDPGRETREIKAAELMQMAEFFREDPPMKDPRRIPLGEEFDPDPDPDAPLTAGEYTGNRGIPEDATAQIDVTGGLGAGGITIVSDGVPGAKGMTFAAEHIRDYWRLPPEVLAALGLRPTDVIVIPVQGDSMADTLIEGDYVFIDTRHRVPSPDGLYALTDDFGGIVVKRLEMASDPGAEDPKIRIKSDNPRHKPKIQLLEHTRIMGRVIRRFGALKADR